jgi:hypothetical protein
MATVLEDILPKSSVLLCGFFVDKNNSMQRIFIKKCFLFKAGSVCRVKRFTTESRNVANFSLVTEVWKWLRQQSKDFCAAGFDALVKRLDKRSEFRS